MKRIYSILLGAILAGSPVIAAPGASWKASAPEPSSGNLNLNLPDPHKELRQLSRDLKLKRGQRTEVGVILQERTREIRLLIDIEPVSQEYRDTLVARVMQESDAQIEALLQSKQRRRFDKELARGRELR